MGGSRLDGYGGIAFMFGSFVAGKSLLPCLWFFVAAHFWVGKSALECNMAFNSVSLLYSHMVFLLPYDLFPSGYRFVRIYLISLRDPHLMRRTCTFLTSRERRRGDSRSVFSSHE